MAAPIFTVQDINMAIFPNNALKRGFHKKSSDLSLSKPELASDGDKREVYYT